MKLAQLLEGKPKIGSGCYQVVYDAGDHVIKVPRHYDGIASSARAYLYRLRRARLTVRLTKKVQRVLGTGIIPKTEMGPYGTVWQEKLDGRIPGYFFGPDMEMWEKVIADINVLVEKAKEGFGDQSHLIDRNSANFFFTDTGKLVGWFDPVIPE